MTIAITTVLPEPVAILEHSLWNSPPSDGMSMPTFPASGPSVSQMSVSAASNWQKKKAAGLELLDVGPVLEQSLRDAGYAGVAVLAPSPHPLTDLVYQRDWDELAGIVEALGVLGCSEESGCPPPLREVEQPCLAVVLPVAGRLVIRRVDYEAVYGCLGHMAYALCGLDRV